MTMSKAERSAENLPQRAEQKIYGLMHIRGEGRFFPEYISRREEKKIYREVDQVRKAGQSRAVLLYGLGGVGKTWLVRGMVSAGAANTDSTTIWLDPIDVDDSEYWLLSNLERQIANTLDPDKRYFRPYQDYINRLPGYTRPYIGHETVVSHLGQIKQIFVECYKRFVTESNATVVITFDTVEAIRGMYLLLTLTQWIKELPSTLFILACRPLPGNDDKRDPIKNELEEPYRGIPVKIVRLGCFTRATALRYLNNSNIGRDLEKAEKKKLVYLTRGHPLWLAFTISYLYDKGVPEEATVSLEEIRRNIPYHGTVTPAGEILQEAFKRRLVTPYRGSSFWHEAIKRLAVLRQGINSSAWQRLIADRQPPPGTVSRNTWEDSLEIPWIRSRANGRQVTLHDAVAEELAHRIIPVHDQDSQWRDQLWQRAVDVYGELTEGPEPALRARQAGLDKRLMSLRRRLSLESENRMPREEEISLMREVASLDSKKRELDQFKAIRLFYQLLSDFDAGCQQFLKLFEQASEENDALFMDLLALEMLRFLPGGVHSNSFGDVVARVIDDFRRWLPSERPQLYLEIGLSVAAYLLKSEQPAQAIALLDTLPSAEDDAPKRYQLSVLRGNACMRIPGRVREGLPHFVRALEYASSPPSADDRKLIAEAHKELGYYYRNMGKWKEADDAYKKARDTIHETQSGQSPDEDREEMASIQTNWAYVKGLRGSYRNARNLVESAINVRHRLGKHQEEAISWSVSGEVYRYERRFHKAWDAYATAEQIFDEQRNWGWLGVVYQEQAICLFQAKQDGIILTETQDPLDRARHLITVALGICRDQAVRGYPSALNRAGRIFGADDPEDGLRYLSEGIDWARQLSDGWFLFANLIEYAELSYQAWLATGQQRHRDAISARVPDIEQAMEDYEFSDLRGRWSILRGHLSVRDWLDTANLDTLRMAVRYYEEGFALVANADVGSSGALAIPAMFTAFRDHLDLLPSDVRNEWHDELRRAWSSLPPEQASATMLLARLEELY